MTGDPSTHNPAAGALIFIITASVILCVSGVAGWIVAAVGCLMLFGTTLVLMKWIRDGQLEESKHTYLMRTSPAPSPLPLLHPCPPYPLASCGTTAGVRIMPLRVCLQSRKSQP